MASRDTSGMSRVQKVPKTKVKWKRVEPARMEEVVERLGQAFLNVAANQGAPGPDRQSIEQVCEHLPELLVELRAALLDGSYRPGEIRRVWIPKAGGGQRGLGIPNRVVRAFPGLHIGGRAQYPESGRAHSETIARDRAEALEEPANERTPPHRAWCQAEDGVATCL